MSDDLVKRLRDACRGGDTCNCSLNEAADRIEALERERDRFEFALARTCLVGGTTYLVERAEAAEAHLAECEARLSKVVKALRPFARYADKETCKITMIWKDGGYQSTYTDTLKPKHFFAAHDTLAELGEENV